MCFKRQPVLAWFIFFVTLIIGTYARAETSIDDLNKATQNPIANLTTVPFQNDIMFGAGPNKETQDILHIQPVMPIKINDQWNLITRTIFEITQQPTLLPGIKSAFGLGDTFFTMFLSPNSKSKFIWGAGPAFLFPTATDLVLGGGKWAAGPSFVGLVQDGHWTTGLLFNHVWSFAGNNKRQAVSQMLLEPFFAYSFKHGWSMSLISETTYDKYALSGNRWTVPLDLTASKIIILGKQALSFGGGFRYIPIRPQFQSAWGVRITMSLLFPD